MQWFLAFHIIGLILWLGGLLDLTRILGYHVKEEIPVQVRLSWMEFRMYWFVSTPGMLLSVIMGLLLFVHGGGVDVYFGGAQKWFVVKFVLALFLIIIHFALGKMLMTLRAEPQKTNPARFKAMHGITGLIFIGVVLLVFLKPF